MEPFNDFAEIDQLIVHAGVGKGRRLGAYAFPFLEHHRSIGGQTYIERIVVYPVSDEEHLILSVVKDLWSIRDLAYSPAQQIYFSPRHQLTIRPRAFWTAHKAAIADLFLNPQKIRTFSRSSRKAVRITLPPKGKGK